MTDCQHLKLKKCLVGETKFYRCEACGVTPASMEVYEKQVDSVSSFGGTITSQSSFLSKSGTS